MQLAIKVESLEYGEIEEEKKEVYSSSVVKNNITQIERELHQNASNRPPELTHNLPDSASSELLCNQQRESSKQNMSSEENRLSRPIM